MKGTCFDPGRLALHGGSPAVTLPLPSWPRPDEAVREALLQAYDSGHWGRYHGEFTDRLRDQLASRHGGCEVRLCSSGTVGVEIALRALQIGTGHQVALAAYDFPGNFRAVEAVGARPILVDIDPDRWCMGADALSEAIERYAVDAAIVSHLHGGLAEFDRIRELADRRGVGLIEDACQAVGATVHQRPVGQWGDLSVLSFGGSKLLTAGRGGAVMTSDLLLGQRLTVVCERGNDAFPLSQLQAAVLSPQLDHLDRLNDQRLSSVRQLVRRLQDVHELRAVRFGDSGEDRSSFYKLAWRFKPPAGCRSRRADLLAALQAEGVPIDAGFRGFARRGPARCQPVGELQHSRNAAEQTIVLHHPALLGCDKLLVQIAEAIHKVLKAVRV